MDEGHAARRQPENSHFECLTQAGKYGTVPAVVSRLSIALLAVIFSVVIVWHAPPVASVPGAPTAGPDAPAAGPQWSNRSYYVASPSPDAIRHLGCSQGDQQGRMSLFFGAPVGVGGGVGATLWGGSDLTTHQIGELMKEFTRGYALCRQPGNQLMVGMGTSTSAINNKPDPWLTVHGRNWSDTVAELNAWANHHHPGTVRIYGAWDPEPSWSSPHKAEMWMQGYAGRPDAQGLHVHASADGCPRETSDDGACSNGWRQHNLFRLAWQWGPALPMPQIYASSGVNGRQWQKIDEYGARYHGDGFMFYGVMSQAGACTQVGGCRGTGNSAAEAHDQLLWHLNASPITAQPSIESATDIQWHR